MRQNGSYAKGRSGSRSTPRRDLGQLPGGQRKRRRKPDAMYLNHSRGFSDRSARIGNSRTSRRQSRLPYALIAVGCAFVLFIAAVVGYVNRSVDIVLNGEQTSVRVGSTLQNLIDDQGLTDTYDAGDLLAVDDSMITRRGGEKLSVKVDGKRVKQGKWGSRELTGGEKVTVKDGRDTYEKHEVQATTIEPKLKVEGTGAIEYVKTWGVQGRSEVWIGEQSGKTQDRGEVVPVTDCVVECASVAPKGNEKYVALTFDEAPSGATKQILQMLKEKGVSATFFLSGDATEASSATAKAIVDAGCEVGSNSYSDESLKGQDRDAVREQISKGTEAIRSATGVKTMLLRAPYAAFDEQNWIDAMDLVSAVVSWNVDSGDWLLNGADEQVSTVLESVTPGNIVLLTDSDECSEQTLEALPQIIDGLVAKGYRIVTLSDLVKTDTSLSKKLTSLTKASMPENAVFPQLAEDNDTTD